ncbi:MAG: heavy-metal-associated domain-containing protein [Sphingomonadales bacterium]|nr:heavy-metal-associated domain-containing protein [Sphingomonadales bacterium]
MIAQIEGERGIAPVVSTGDIETGGIEVDVTGKTAAEARQAGWREAYKKAWEQLHGPAMDLGTIESLVSGVVIEREQIGPHRYIARLGVVFDRARAGQYVGGGDSALGVHSAPMLTIPVLYSGGVGQVYEVRTAWQRVWAQFRTGASAIDYVRPSGAGGDSLLITAGQPGRRSRIWWRNVLDQYAASDVLFPVARLERQWPGGPVKGTFTARYGPDNELLGSVSLTAPDEDGVPAMLAQGLKALDGIYSDALARGLLATDPTLSIEHPQIDPSLQALIAKGRAQQALDAQTAAEANAEEAAGLNPPKIEAAPVASEEPVKARPATAVVVQFASPDARAVDQALAAVRGAGGVSGASTVSLAIGGTSVMRANYAGNPADLAAALRAKGWKVSVSGTTLRISR